MPTGIYKRTKWHLERQRAGTRYVRVTPGQVIGKRVILKELPQKGNHRRQFLYRCVCGNTSTVALTHLNDGYGCGCARESGIWAATEAKRKPKFTASFNQLLAGYKRAAKKRGLAWELSEHHFRALTKQPCHYCGKPPTTKATHGSRHNGDYVYNGLDRRNNAHGYTPANTVACCKTCNYAKQSMTEKDFAAWVTAVYTHYVSDLNSYINTQQQQFSAPPEGIPVTDHTQQVNVGLEMAQRMGQRQEPPAPVPMTPIVPVAN